MSQEPNRKYTEIELEIIAEQVLNIMPAQYLVYPEFARAMKAKFDALVTAGFTEQQALDIVTARNVIET